MLFFRSSQTHAWRPQSRCGQHLYRPRMVRSLLQGRHTERGEGHVSRVGIRERIRLTTRRLRTKLLPLFRRTVQLSWQRDDDYTMLREEYDVLQTFVS